MKITRLATLRAKAHFVGHTEHGHAFLGEPHHHVEHFLDHFRIESRRWLIEQHDLRIHAQRPGDRDALLLTTGKLPRIFRGLFGDLDPLQIVHGDVFGFLLRHLAHPDRGKRAVLEDGQMRKQVEVLEAHTDFAADLIDLFQVI